jgi:uncharacterized protein YifE (UPF0438 family)
MSRSHISDAAPPVQETLMFDNMKRARGFSSDGDAVLEVGALKQDNLIEQYDHDNFLTWLN